jgi:UDPglucose 6-dehydrogenase
METLIFGQGIRRAMHPERYVLGSVDSKIPESIKTFLSIDKCEIFIFNFESAELSKLAMNFFLATTITATNTLSVLAAKLGANWNEISHALKMDKRIGNYAYLTPGLGIGGSNIIRDLMEIKRLSYQHAIESSVIESILTNSNYMSNWISREFNKYLSTFENLELKIGLLGLTYKKDTHSIIRSSGLQFLKSL